MTYTEKRLESLEQSVKEVTDYGFNDEYGYYNDWADGVRPILEKAIAQAIAEERERVRGVIEIIKQKYNKIPTSVVNVKIMGVFCEILASLDKPLTDNKDI